MTLEKGKIYKVSMGLLGMWICAEKNHADLEEIISFVWDGAFMDCPRDLIADRLYGGFACADDKNRRHIYFSAGQFTYLGSNVKLTGSEREKMWKDLFEVNKDNFIGDGIFTADCPKELYDKN